ncbi:MAG: BREX-3 system phosphatase PglZ [Desulfitobacteriaceae bacterium]|nr:BREX-3 system phosphatase PglZ [Desulfitobacteriaceae bacterium]
MQGEKAILRDLLFEKAGLPWVERLIIYDTDNLVSRTAGTNGLYWDEYSVFEVKCSEELRFIYERDCRQTKKSTIFIVPSLDIKIPYDIYKQFSIVTLGFDAVFPKLNTSTLRASRNIDFDYLSIATKFLSGRRLTAEQTKAFLTVDMFNQEIVDAYSAAATRELFMRLASCKIYSDWTLVVDLLSKLMLLRDKGFIIKGVQETYSSVDLTFRNWISERYSSLAASADISQPVMLHHVLDFVRRNSRKPAIIVIDGMSFVDWQLIHESFADAPWRLKVNAVFSFIPTITSIARQSLLSGTIPVQNAKTFSLVDEEKQWRHYWTERGLRDDEIFFGKTETPEIPEKIKAAGIVVNFIDDLIHRQLQGTHGMAVDIVTWLKNGTLRSMIDNLLFAGFDVYLTADHGHAEAVGMGRFTKPGLLTESVSRRAVIYKDFAGAEELDKFKACEYAGTYMPKNYRYFLLANGECIGDRGNKYIAHGGDSIEELLVPFVRIGEKQNG